MPSVCSSVSALGNFYENEPVGEDYPLRPTSIYGASKAAVDLVLRGLWGKVPLDLCSLRFTVIYGPGRETVFTVEKIVTEETPAQESVSDYTQYLDPKYAEQLMSETIADEDLPSVSLPRKGAQSEVPVEGRAGVAE